MNTYKITNLTNTAGKRDFRFNSSLDIEYVDNMIKKTVSVKPGASLYLTVSSLPMSVHKLRVKNLISVIEVSAKELADFMNNAKPKSAPVAVKELVTEEVTAEETAKRSSRKKKE
jgi:hypothetical protein